MVKWTLYLIAGVILLACALSATLKKGRWLLAGLRYDGKKYRKVAPPPGEAPPPPPAASPGAQGDAAEAADAAEAKPRSLTPAAPKVQLVQLALEPIVDEAKLYRCVAAMLWVDIGLLVLAVAIELLYPNPYIWLLWLIIPLFHISFWTWIREREDMLILVEETREAVAAGTLGKDEAPEAQGEEGEDTAHEGLDISVGDEEETLSPEPGEGQEEEGEGENG